MLNKELYMVVLPAISWLLFALGGTEISDKIKGQKWIRRYVMPFILMVFCFSGGYWWRGVGVGMLSGGFFVLGYGITKPYWYKFLVGVSYSLISIPIGLNVWNIVTAIAFITLFVLSNTKLTAKMFIWKICEGFFGLFVGIQLAYSLMGYGLIWG